jgi:hypothetical protein
MTTARKTVRMLCSAEGEFSLSAGRVYSLERELAESFLNSGAAEVPEKGHEAAIVPGVNEPAEHHRSDYVEFPELPGREVEPAPAAPIQHDEAPSAIDGTGEPAAAEADPPRKPRSKR